MLGQLVEFLPARSQIHRGLRGAWGPWLLSSPLFTAVESPTPTAIVGESEQSLPACGDSWHAAAKELGVGALFLLLLLQPLAVGAAEQPASPPPSCSPYLLQEICLFNGFQDALLGGVLHLPPHQELVQDEVGFFKVENDVQFTHLGRRGRRQGGLCS